LRSGVSRGSQAECHAIRGLRTGPRTRYHDQHRAVAQPRSFADELRQGGFHIPRVFDAANLTFALKRTTSAYELLYIFVHTLRKKFSTTRYRISKLFQCFANRVRQWDWETPAHPDLGCRGESVRQRKAVHSIADRQQAVSSVHRFHHQSAKSINFEQRVKRASPVTAHRRCPNLAGQAATQEDDETREAVASLTRVTAKRMAARRFMA